MKKLKTMLNVALLLMASMLLNAQSKVKVPDCLQGFWHYEGAIPGDYDGVTIGEDYIEFWYRIFYIESLEKTTNNGYRVLLQHENGEIIELLVFNLKEEQADIWFTSWDKPKACKRLDWPTYTEKMPANELPKVLFREWTNGGKGEVKYRFDGSDTVFYENREWRIVWAAYYYEKEYRLLINCGEKYKMIYVLSITDQSLTTACNLQTEVFSPLAENRDVYKILGNWAQKNTNAWQLGFFEDFAIYGGDFWNYKKLTFNDSDGEIVLYKGEESIKLTLQLKNEELCSITIDEVAKGDFFKCDKNLPSFSNSDSNPFKESQFQKIDTVTIKGYLRNNPFSKPFSVSFIDPIKDDQVEFFADVNKEGQFTLKFPLISSTQVYLDWGRMTKIDVVEPGESYLIFFDFSNQQHLVMGDNERFHNELAAYEIYSANRDMSNEEYQRIDSLEAMDYLKNKKDELEKSYLHLNKYIEENPFVSEKFKYYSENNYRFTAASHLMQRRFKLDRNNRERFPEGFMEYVSDTLYQNNPIKPFTLTREYLYFMRDFIDYQSELSGNNSFSVSGMVALRFMEKEGLLKLSEDDSSDIIKFEEYMSLLDKLHAENADSTKMAEAVKPYSEVSLRITTLFESENVKSFLQNEWQEKVSELLDEKQLVGSLSNFDELVQDSLLKDIFEAQQFYWLIDYRKMPLSDAYLQLLHERVSNPALKAIILTANEYYNQLNKQDIFYTESLKNTEHLKDAKNADLLFAQLTEPYKGKVVYVDFWGTWCGPCRQEMKYVGAVKDALKDKDVIFMYFAKNSPEASWKNVIKENHLSGDNVVHYNLPKEQQEMIERRLSIRAYPTFILMDKAGTIVNMKAPRPRDKNKLVGEIDKLLSL